MEEGAKNALSHPNAASVVHDAERHRPQPWKLKAPVEIFDYNQVSAVRSVPVVEDWRSLSQADFLERADCPMIFQSLGADIEAKKRWDRRFLGQFSDEMVQVKSTFALNSSERIWSTEVRLRDFISAIEAGEERVYAAEWYIFRNYPELLQDVTSGFPEYLLDDWLELIPASWAFGTEMRTNLYWGAPKSITPIHYDSLNACTWNVTLKGSKRWLLFSTREFEITAPQCWQQLQEKGFVTEYGLFTPEAVQRYVAKPPDGFPKLQFYVHDVTEGNTIYVPWRWGHQIQNIDEVIAVSHYYISRENYPAAVHFMRDNFGRVLTFLVRALIGNGTTRAILKTPFVRKLLAHRLTTASFQTLMRLVAPDYITFVDTIKKMP